MEEDNINTNSETPPANPASGLSTILLIFIIVGAVAYGAYYVLYERTHQEPIQVEQETTEVVPAQ